MKMKKEKKMVEKVANETADCNNFELCFKGKN